MGTSPVHAETIAVVQNLNARYLSPQCHVVFDDAFETVHADADEPPPVWEDLCIFQRFQTEFDEGVTLQACLKSGFPPMSSLRTMSSAGCLI